MVICGYIFTTADGKLMLTLNKGASENGYYESNDTNQYFIKIETNGQTLFPKLEYITKAITNMPDNYWYIVKKRGDNTKLYLCNRLNRIQKFDNKQYYGYGIFDDHNRQIDTYKNEYVYKEIQDDDIEERMQIMYNDNKYFAENDNPIFKIKKSSYRQNNIQLKSVSRETGFYINLEIIFLTNNTPAYDFFMCKYYIRSNIIDGKIKIYEDSDYYYINIIATKVSTKLEYIGTNYFGMGGISLIDALPEGISEVDNINYQKILTGKVSYSGTFDEKPNSSSGIEKGFSYFCTDRKTTEGGTNGIPIYHKGNNVWVDALGRIVE